MPTTLAVATGPAALVEVVTERVVVPDVVIVLPAELVVVRGTTSVVLVGARVVVKTEPAEFVDVTTTEPPLRVEPPTPASVVAGSVVTMTEPALLVEVMTTPKLGCTVETMTEPAELVDVTTEGTPMGVPVRVAAMTEPALLVELMTTVGTGRRAAMAWVRATIWDWYCGGIWLMGNHGGMLVPSRAEVKRDAASPVTLAAAAAWEMAGVTSASTWLGMYFEMSSLAAEV